MQAESVVYQQAVEPAFQHYTTQHRVVAWVSQHLFAGITYTQRRGLLKGMRRKGGLGFLPSGAVNREEAFLRSLPLAGKVIYDIGAFEGLFTLFFAARAKQVIAFEPNPQNQTKCITNIALNRLTNVNLIQEGVSAADGIVTLTFDPLMPGAGTSDPLIGDQVQQQARHAKRLRIRVMALDDHIAEKDLPIPDLIKIDIEGLELDALEGMRQTIAKRHPELYIELHGATIAQKIEISHSVIRFLEAHGYTIYEIEHGRHLTSATLGDHRPSHIYCEKRCAL